MNTSEDRTTVVLIPGGGGASDDWSLVAPMLADHGWTVVAPDLPAGDDAAGIEEYADVVETALSDSGEWGRLVVVGHSLGSYTAIALADRVDVDHLVYLCAMIPAPGETSGQWWAATGQSAAQGANEVSEGRDPDPPWDDVVIFMHDTPADILAEVQARPTPPQSFTPFDTPNTWTAWQSVPSTAIVGRLDRMFPFEFAAGLVRERLGIEPHVIDAGHMPGYSRPRELAAVIIAAPDRS